MAKRPQTIEAKIESLVQDHFPWGEKEPFNQEKVLPTRPENPQDAKKEVCEWLEDKLFFHNGEGLGLAEIIGKGIDFLKKEKKPERFYARIDDSNLTKSPESILEKMARFWSLDQGEPLLHFEQIYNLKDLARFRIVTNFLQDANEIKEQIEGALKGALNVFSELTGKFLLENGEFKDSMYILPSERKKGERCYKGVFQSALYPYVLIEVQIVTMLQEAWDKKDHFLVYERKRKGENITKEQEIQIYAMSESLYLMDILFEKIYKDVTSSPAVEVEGEKEEDKRS